MAGEEFGNGPADDDEARDDPTRGAEYANRTEIFFGVFHLAEGDGVAERDRGHVAERVGEENDVHRAEAGLRCGEPQEDAAEGVECGEEFLIGEEFVGH